MGCKTTTSRDRGRWGNNHVDNRNWVRYNEELFVRGEFLLDMSMFENWGSEVLATNEGKRWRPFKFPSSFVMWQAAWHQWLDCRSLEGVVRSLAYMGLISAYDDYTTVWCRIHAMKPEITLPSAAEVEAASDGSGMRTGNAGEYRAYRYGVRGRVRRYVVVIITADVKRRKLLAVDAHIEGRGASEHGTAVRHLKKLNENGKTVTRFQGDGSYDTNDMSDALGGASSAIKIRANSSTDYCRGSKRRRREIRDYHRLGYRRLAEQTGYGMR